MKQKTRWYWILAIFIPPIPLVLVVQSCIFGTDTYLCESGRRCEPGQVCAANQDVCINIGGCGDGIVSAERGEVCDDGNIRDGDGCSKDCKSKEECGNGIVDSAKGESCDDGNTVRGDGCSDFCILEACGNSTIDTYEIRDGGIELQEGVIILDGGKVREACDDGEEGQDIAGDGCSRNCLSNEVCGNGILDRDLGDVGVPEECDPGAPGQNTDLCNYNCTSACCGDGIYNSQTIITAPDAGCPQGAACSDSDAGVVYNEQCDSGDVDGGTPLCEEDCTLPICGDGYINPAVEDCEPDEPGNNQPDCNANCTTARCGDAIWNPLHTPDGGGATDGEECDEGGDEPTCDLDCTFPRCGDGHLNPNYITDAGIAEECDKGGDDQDCDKDCTFARCGDGYLNPTHVTDAGIAEECDKGGDAPDCDRNCTFARCGDGYLNPTHITDAGVNEECDEGGDTQICDKDCTPAMCGDGYLNPNHVTDAGPEQCETIADCRRDGGLRVCNNNCQCE